VAVRDAIASGLARDPRMVVAASPRAAAYVPDSGRFEVSAPGTPFASPDHAVNLDLLTRATRRRRA
jgi:hypothetical protein